MRQEHPQVWLKYVPDEGGGILRLSILLSLIRDWLGGGGQHDTGGVSMVTVLLGVCRERMVRHTDWPSVSNVSTNTISSSDTTLPLITSISSLGIRPVVIYRMKQIHTSVTVWGNKKLHRNCKNICMYIKILTDRLLRKYNNQEKIISPLIWSKNTLAPQLICAQILARNNPSRFSSSFRLWPTIFEYTHTVALLD